MNIRTQLDPSRPLQQRWKAVDADSYDGAEDSPTRHQIGFGIDMNAAIADLKEQLES